MTKEEKINIFVEQILKEEGVSDTWVNGFKGGLGVMYDVLSIDFESRTCENCNILNKNGYCRVVDTWVDKDFGCNKWGAKDESN